MSFAKTIEMTADSDQGFEDAIVKGIDKAQNTLEQVRSIWVKDQQVFLSNGSVDQYRVRMLVTFELK